MKGILGIWISRARRKLQAERLARGAAILVGAFFLGSLLSSYILAQYNFSDTVLFWTRLAGALGLLVLFAYYLFKPLLKPPTSRQVARFLEERHPELEERLSTAVELEISSSETHPEIRRLVTSDARRRLVKLPTPRLYHPQKSLLSLLVLFCSLVAFALLFFRGPDIYPYSLNKMIRWFDDTQPPLYSIQVTPGNITVGKRTDLEIEATLQGFNAEKIHLEVRYENHPQWEETLMRPRPDGGNFVFVFFDIRDRIEYYVKADGIKSETYTIEVSEIPRVDDLKVVLKFPDYTGLQDVTQEDEGDIRALVGTEAELLIRTDQPVQNGSIRLETGREVALELLGPRELKAAFQVEQDDYYRILLQDLEGFWNPASDEYVIEALQDQPPSVTFTRPGRDQKVTNIEEVFTQIRAEDDYGVERLQLHYSINGEPQQEAQLDYPKGSRSFSTSHTFYLEEFGLEPGDFVSYFAEAHDPDSVSLTDIYFFEVQPYDREYYQSQQGGAMGGAGGPSTSMLSKRQKEIVAGTFNLERRRNRYTSSEFQENSQTLALVQQRLQGETQTIVERIERRGVVGLDKRFQKMMDHLKQAITHMEPAHQQLNQENTKAALPEEQKSLQQLLRAESLLKEIQVSFAQNQGGGGASAEQLADLVDLELDRTKNQYETLQQNRELNREQALDEALEKLKELARRQEQLVQRHRRQAMQSGSANSNLSQQELIEETERLARELERLSRQQQDPKLQEIERQLRQASRDMRQAQSQGQNDSEAQMRAQQALERLKEARNSLGQQRESRVQSSIQNLRSESERLVREQHEVVEEVGELEEKLKSGAVDQDYIKQLRRLLSKKSHLQEDLQQLEGDLHQLSRQIGSKQPGASRKLKQAALDIRDQRLPDKMQEGTELLSRGWNDMARRREEGLVEDLQELADNIRQAQEAFGPANQSDPRERLEQALNQLGSLLENLESLEERASGENEEQQSGPADQGASQEESAQDQQQGRQSEGQQGQQAQGSANDSRSAGETTGSERASSQFGTRPRQLGREWRERLQDAQQLRELLKDQSQLGTAAAGLIRRMKRIDAKRLFSDPEEVARLKSQIIDGFRQLELEINRSLQEDARNVLRLVNRDEVPAEYRQRVEEYYRALSSGENP